MKSGTILVIATRNRGKLHEFRSLLRNTSFRVLSLLDFPDYTPLEESGESFQEIASKKASHAAAHLHHLTLADDSGLVVPALGGAPGIYSARFASAHATDFENLQKLLSLISPLQEADRAAYFECALALADPSGSIIKVTTGYSEGTLITNPRGAHGFGYDPIFLKHDYGKTFAELETEIKNRISHRSKAIEKMRSTLSQYE